MAESISGFHFISTYQQCPRKFLLKYVYHLVPEFKSPALLFGIAIHAALEVWAKEKSLDKAQDAFENELAKEQPDYEKTLDYQNDLQRGLLLLAEYDRTWHENDGEKLETLYVELPFDVELANGFHFTGRIDRVVQEKDTKNVYILEYKTTSWSAPSMAHNVTVGDQVTSYLFGLRKVKPTLKVIGVVPDVLYNRGNSYVCTRFTPVMRTEMNLKEFELQIIGQLLTISQKVQNLGDYPWPYLFPRNCGASPFKCEYEDICRLNLKADDVPVGFKKEKDSEEIINHLIDCDSVDVIRRRY